MATTDGDRRRAILRGRAERRDLQRPTIPWHARAWSWFFPGSESDRSHDGLHLVVILAVVALVAALCSTIAWNLASGRPSSRIVVSDALYASGQEGNVIEDLSAQGFRNAEAVEGLGVAAWGTPGMVDEYRRSWDDGQVDAAGEVLADPPYETGVASVGRSDDWSTITVSTYTDVADVDVVRYVLTIDEGFSSALDTWIGWAVMMTGDAITVDLMDATGARYFSVPGVSRVADIVTGMQEQNPEGVDWESLVDGMAGTRDDGEAGDGAGAADGATPPGKGDGE